MGRIEQTGFVVVLCVAAGLDAVAQAEEARPAPQYRFGRTLIPGATADEPLAVEFSPESAQQYVELGPSLWARQKKCVSCHTHGIYAITRPSLSPYWGTPPESLRQFLTAQADELIESGDTSYSAPAKMAYLARGLAEWDAHVSGNTTPETDRALRHLLELPSEDGSMKTIARWPPLNSDTWHATTMAAMAVATAPGWRESVADTRIEKRIKQLETYLRETPPQHDHHRLLLLWASTRIPGLLTAEQRAGLQATVWKHQLADGGWSIRTFATAESLGGGKKAERMSLEADYLNPTSDGYQTGLAIVVLRDSGVPASDPRIQKAVRWLLTHQRETGRWWTRSLNIDSRFHYITYSGTAYAVLALAKCGEIPSLESAHK